MYQVKTFYTPGGLKQKLNDMSLYDDCLKIDTHLSIILRKIISIFGTYAFLSAGIIGHSIFPALFVVKRVSNYKMSCLTDLV